MPHLDANALTDDPQGMTFLAKVIGAPSDPAVAAERITLSDEAMGLGQIDCPCAIDRPMPKGRRRKSSALVPEAA